MTERAIEPIWRETPHAQLLEAELELEAIDAERVVEEELTCQSSYAHP